MSNQFLLTFALDPIWRRVVPWFAQHALRMDEKISVFTNGSGDTTYNYVSLLLYVIISALATILWSVLDRRRAHYQAALQWLIVLVRYYVVFQMVMYGMAKLLYLQFQPPSYARLLQPYGDSSPMGLLWTFMGYSKGYTMFTGAGELIGGLLLLHRRTVTLGAMIVFGVMANVMALNFFYDVPVKILSSHLVFLSLFLILLDTQRLWNLFVVNRPTEAGTIPPLFANPKLEKAKNIAKWVIVVGGLGAATISSLSMLRKWGPNANRSPLEGLYEVTSFVKNNEAISTQSTDSTRWKKLIVERKDRATVQMMNDRKLSYLFQPDTSRQIVLFRGEDNATVTDTLRFSYPGDKQMLLEGVYRRDTLKIMLSIKKKEDFLLMERGFRWVNEYPFNR